MLFLRLNALYPVTVIIQILCLAGVPYKSFVMGGYSALFPMMMYMITGISCVSNLEQLKDDDYEVSRVV